MRIRGTMVIALACSAVLCAEETTVGMDDPARRAAENAHAELWRRFVSEHGILFDFVTPKGEVIVPTPQECAACRPNGLGYWCPIENGAFFNGLYLDGLCNRWRARGRKDQDATSARRIARGLLLLARVGQTPGFIARGVATDGKGHHPAGSDDQTLPWFYGLWRYVKSGIPGESEKRETVRLMVQTARALETARWRMPCDMPSFATRGRWTSKSPVSTPRVLFVTRAMHDLTGDSRWLAVHERLRDGKPDDSAKTRLEICSDGTLAQEHSRPELSYFSFWTKASCQACLGALAEMESDPGIRRHYEAGRDTFARFAAQHIARSARFSNNNASVFVHDWRVLNEWWRPQKGINDIVAVARAQSKRWYRMSPRKWYEARFMQEPLFAAWIVTLSNDRDLIAQARNDIRAALTHYDWTKTYYSTFFAAVCAYYEGIDAGL